MSPATPSVESLQAMFDELKNWGRWGEDDQSGTLNLITPEKRAAAAALVTDGTAVSCALDFPTSPAPDNPHPALHMMNVAGDACTLGPIGALQATSDFIGVSFHGMASSHIDALCHILVDGQMYNGYAKTDVLSTGAQKNSIMVAAHGIVSRGILLDVPMVHGVEWLEPGYQITVDDLDAAESAHGVSVEAGDVLLVNTGRHCRRAEVGAWPVSEGLAGLHAECLPWLHERGVSLLGSDGVSDPMPGFNVPGWRMPVHQIGIAGLGLHLLDNLELRGVSDACAQHSRWEFLFVVSPLRVEGGTGSPVNPIAVF
jgi:kynurenine formamidase